MVNASHVITQKPPMAPKLPVSTYAGIRCIIETGGFTNQQIPAQIG
jgi:hypothetical protein